MTTLPRDVATEPFRSVDKGRNFLVSTELSSFDVVYTRGMTTSPATATPGQPRKPAGAAVLQPDKTDAIVAAFYDVLTESGHDKLTMDRVAARAGVGKAALYRRWRSKEQMLTELVAETLDLDYAKRLTAMALRALGVDPAS